MGANAQRKFKFWKPIIDAYEVIKDMVGQDDTNDYKVAIEEYSKQNPTDSDWAEKAQEALDFAEEKAKERNEKMLHEEEKQATVSPKKSVNVVKPVDIKEQESQTTVKAEAREQKERE